MNAYVYTYKVAYVWCVAHTWHRFTYIHMHHAHTMHTHMRPQTYVHIYIHKCIPHHQGQWRRPAYFYLLFTYMHMPIMNQHQQHRKVLCDTHIHIHVCIHTCIYIHKCIPHQDQWRRPVSPCSLCSALELPRCTCKRKIRKAYAHVHMYVCVYVCVCVYIYIYIYMHISVRDDLECS
jgi:hypothetical protein